MVAKKSSLLRLDKVRQQAKDLGWGVWDAMSELWGECQFGG